MKIIGLDLGDKWVGISLSDALGMTCKPYKTSTITTILTDLVTLCTQENIRTVVVGLPKTLAGNSSEQTKKIEAQAAALQSELSSQLNKTIELVFWDERLSSKMARSIGQQVGGKKHHNAQHEHAVAACLILQGYLDSKGFF